MSSRGASSTELAEDPAATEQGLRELTTAELVHEQELFPEVTYRFKHALTHDVAYEALGPAAAIRARTRPIGLALEELYPDRLAEHAEILARPLLARRDAGRRRFEYLLQAAQKAANAFAIREARALYDQALEADQRAGGTATPTALHRRSIAPSPPSTS